MGSGTRQHDIIREADILSLPPTFIPKALPRLSVHSEGPWTVVPFEESLHVLQQRPADLVLSSSSELIRIGNDM